MVVREGGTDYAPDADGGVLAGWLVSQRVAQDIGTPITGNLE